MSNSKSKDTSLDDILDQFVQPGTKYLKDVQADIMAWHKAEIAKLLQVIEDEVIKADEDKFADVPDYAMMKPVYYVRNRLRHEQRQVLKKIKERLGEG